MTSPIVDPEIPYNGDIPGGLQPGKMLRLQGVTHPDADRFNINFQTGPTAKPRDDTALHLSVRLNQGYIARNSYRNGSWEDEQGSGQLPIGKSQAWEILFLVDEQDYKIAVNGQHFCEFPHRISFKDVTHLLIDGDVSITLISWESIVGVGGNESASKASALNAEGPQAPQQPSGNFVPQGGYGPPGNYGPPGGYGPPPPGNYGYGVPPPPGAQPESGFDNFLEQAQSVLAGAIKSGAAEKLLGNIFSSGQPQQQQGYAHQNAKYGIYPELPQDMDLNGKATQMKQQPGPVESLLSSLLSGGNKHQQTPQNSLDPSEIQKPNEPQLDLTSLLSGLLNTKQQQTNVQNQPIPNAYYPVEQQNQNVDWGAVLGGLISGGNQQIPHSNAPPGQVPVGSGPNPLVSTPQNVSGDHKNESVDWGGLLSGLISSGNQQTQYESPNPQSGQNIPQQSKGIDLNLLLGSLISGAAAQTATRPIQETGKPQNPTQNTPNSQQTQGMDLGQLLTRVLSNVAQPQPQGQVPPAAPCNVQGGTQIPQALAAESPQIPNAYGNQQPQGFNLGSLLTNLLSPGQPNSSVHGPQGHSVPTSSNFPNHGTGTQNTLSNRTNPSNRPDNRPATGSHVPQIPAQTNTQKASDTKRQISQPATQEEIEDVSDKLAEVIAAESKSSEQHSSQNQQYGQYPHPQSNQGQGPVESLLSSFLGGSGGQTHQQQQHQFGGGESIGGLGSMSGLLQNFAGQILQPRDPNQRQNY